MSRSPSDPPARSASAEEHAARAVELLSPLKKVRVEVAPDFTRRVVRAIVRADELRNTSNPNVVGLVGRAAREALNLFTGAMNPHDAGRSAPSDLPPPKKDDKE